MTNWLDRCEHCGEVFQSGEEDEHIACDDKRTRWRIRARLLLQRVLDTPITDVNRAQSGDDDPWDSLMWEIDAFLSKQFFWAEQARETKGYVVVGENASRLWIVVPGDGDIRQGSHLLTKADADSLVAHMTAAQFPGCTYRAVPLPGLSAVPETGDAK